MVGEIERFDQTGGYSHTLLDDNKVLEKSTETFGGEYARSEREFCRGHQCIRFQLEEESSHGQANDILIGIISSGITATDLYFNQTPSLYAWGTSSLEWENERIVVKNGMTEQVSKDKWPGAQTGDILELSIDCDHQMITIKNQTRPGKDSMNINLENCPFPWRFIVILSTRPDRIRIL